MIDIIYQGAAFGPPLLRGGYDLNGEGVDKKTNGNIW
jgi:hypothetical protein